MTLIIENEKMMDKISFPDTIFALSSGRLPSGIAILRLSGPHVRFVIETIVGAIPESRKSVYVTMRARNGEILDHGLVIFFPKPASFTGEDSVEFHVHGGIAVVDRFLKEFSAFSGCRMAEPGEFTHRAFINGKMDLTTAEGLADLINAETEGQRRLAFQGASGAQRNLYMDWRQKLIEARAFIEAELDFSDEADVLDSMFTHVWEMMRNLSQQIVRHLAEGERAKIFHNGIQVVIIGAPNVGKSSLLNMFAGRDVAIISDEAGTTRDLLEVKLKLSDLLVYVTDTAGIRDHTTGEVEKIGIMRALESAAHADLILLVENVLHPEIISFPKTGGTIWRIGNKVDLAKTFENNNNNWDFCISAKYGDGLDLLIEAIAEFAVSKTMNIGDVVPTRHRHIELLTETHCEIDKAVAHGELGLELRTEHLRRASQCLGRITGDVHVEDILDVIFSEFCIGK